MWHRSSIGLRALKRLPVSAPQTLSPSLVTIRAFTQTPASFKKRKIAPASDGPASTTPSSSSSSSSSSSHSHSSKKNSTSSSTGSSVVENHHAAPDPENPLDFSSLTTSYASTDSHFKAEVQQVLHGGRFNPDVLGAVPVTLKTSITTTTTGSGSPSGQQQTFQLREVAQVVPRSGRTISLLVNDKKYIKDIMSAIQKNEDFNQQPQRSEDNELELFLKVELERKEDLVRRVKDACQLWKDRIRQARTRHEKTLQDWKKNKVVLPDVVRKAEKEMQKLQDKKMKEIGQEEAQAIKQLDRR